jgi:hypothetical protein
MDDSLLDTLRLFCSALSRRDTALGDLSFSTEAQSLVYPEKLAFSDDLRAFYSHTKTVKKPSIGGTLPLEIYQFSQLESAQVGWHWTLEKGSQAIIENPDWSRYWTVIANTTSGDVIFVDTEGNGSSVSGRIQGDTGNLVIAPSLSYFLRLIILCFDVEEKLFPNDSWWDDEDCSIKPAVPEAYSTEIKRTFPEINLDGFMEFFFS